METSMSDLLFKECSCGASWPLNGICLVCGYNHNDGGVIQLPSPEVENERLRQYRQAVYERALRINEIRKTRLKMEAQKAYTVKLDKKKKKRQVKPPRNPGSGWMSFVTR